VQELGDMVGHDHVTESQKMVKPVGTVTYCSPWVDLSTNMSMEARVDAAECIKNCTHVSGKVWRLCQRGCVELHIPSAIDEQVRRSDESDDVCN